MFQDCLLYIFLIRFHLFSESLVLELCNVVVWEFNVHGKYNRSINGALCVRACVCCQLGDVMVDISSNLMLTDERVLWSAQKEERACSRVIESLQKIAVLRLASGSYYTVNILHDVLDGLTLILLMKSVH